jgi:hypothetical protein
MYLVTALFDLSLLSIIAHLKIKKRIHFSFLETYPKELSDAPKG